MTEIVNMCERIDLGAVKFDGKTPKPSPRSCSGSAAFALLRLPLRPRY
jgi:hypothetical protein